MIRRRGGGLLRKTVLMAIAAIAVLVVSAEADEYSDEYSVDTGRSEFVVRLFRGGIAAALGHDHVIRATEFDGGARLDASDPERSFIWVEVQAASLKADEPEIREKYGLAKRISEKDRAKIQATMLSANQMDVENYPTISFRSTGITKQADGEYLIAGDLTIHGVTRSISFPVTVSMPEEGDGGEFHATVSIDFRQSDYGIEPFSAMFGAVRNKDGASLHADIYLFQRDSVPPSDSQTE